MNRPDYCSSVCTIDLFPALKLTSLLALGIERGMGGGNGNESPARRSHDG